MKEWEPRIQAITEEILQRMGGKEGSMSHDEAEEQLAAIKKKNVINVMYIN